MERFTGRPIQILAGLVLAAASLAAQSYTISARPGAINYIEGRAFLNGSPVAQNSLKGLFLNANDSFATQGGKAEILLTPGVFLRVGENAEIRMISPSLTDTKVDLLSGEIMIEASGLVKDNNLQILDHGASITITKNGLYRFKADNPPTAAVLDGHADVSYADRKVSLKNGREVILSANLPASRFNTKAEDDLYAWSNVRSEYEAASSYRLAQEANLSNFNAGFGPSAYGYGGLGYTGLGYGGLGYAGFGPGFGPGWLWNSGFNSYAWLPGNGAFYSPFGYGFYSPGLVGYAPVVNTSIYRGGQPWRNPNRTGAVGTPGQGMGFTAAVPIRPDRPPALGSVASSPFADHQARMQAARAFAAANGGSPGGPSGWHGASGAAHASPGGGSSGAAHSSGGGFSGGGAHASGGGGHSGK